MSGIEAILDDILQVVPRDLFAIAVGSTGLDPVDRAMQVIVESVDDEASLSRWILETFGPMTVLQVVRSLPIDCDLRGPIDGVVRCWLAHRGISGNARPAARPLELVELLRELAHQASAAADKFDAPRLMAPAMQSLLRYLAFYFHGPLGLDRPAPVEESEESREWHDAVACLSFGELCSLLTIDHPVRARPYHYDSVDTVALTAGTVGPALADLASITVNNTGWSPDETRQFSQNMLDILATWTEEQRLVPKGCLVTSYTQTRFQDLVRCHDERGRRLELLGVQTSLAVGMTVLLASSETEQVWAPGVEPLPDGPAWTMPSYGVPDDLEVTEPMSDERRRVFVSYSHKDAAFKNELQTHLAPLVRNATIDCWSDDKIRAGSDWKNEIKSALDRTRVAVLLVSRDFLASDFIQRDEMSVLLRAAKVSGVTILWVPIRASLYEETDLAGFQAAASPKAPLATLPKAKRDQAWVEICKKIKEAFTGR